MHRFLVIVEEADGNYSAYSPDIPGCVATGATREEAEERICEAIEFHIRRTRGWYCIGSSANGSARRSSSASGGLRRMDLRSRAPDLQRSM